MSSAIASIDWGASVTYTLGLEFLERVGSARRTSLENIIHINKLPEERRLGNRLVEILARCLKGGTRLPRHRAMG
jgi:hypothetical protein